jgi:hypothetical protein
MTEDDRLARNRFMVLNFVRLGGLALILAGIAVHYGKIAAPEWVAYALVILGFAEFFFMPNFVARNWRTPGE